MEVKMSEGCYLEKNTRELLEVKEMFSIMTRVMVL